MNLGVLTIAAKRAEKLIGENSPVLLTAAGVTGVLATAYLAVRAAFRAKDLVDDHNEGLSADEVEAFGPKEKFVLVWKEYVPPGICAITTIAAIIAANRIGTKRALAAASAYTLSERAFSEYKDRVKEKIGSTKEQVVRDEIVQDQVKKHPETKNTFVGPGDVLCFDTWSGRSLASTKEKLLAAANRVNFNLNNQAPESVSDFYDQIGLDRNDVSDYLGWSSGQQVVLEWSSGLTKEDRPYLSFTFNPMPKPNYRYSH
jgi:hypothetical protein